MAETVGRSVRGDQAVDDAFDGRLDGPDAQGIGDSELVQEEAVHGEGQ